MTLAETRAVEEIRARLRDPARHGEEILRALYGPGWASSLHHYEDGGRERVRFRRLPKPRKAAEFLRPILAGRLAHDGRARTGRDRSGGWWLLDEDSGSWRAAAVVEVVDVLAEVGEALLAEAIEAEQVAEYAVDSEEYAAGESGRRRKAGGAPRAVYRERSRAREVAAAFDSLSGLLESGLTTLGAVLAFFRERPEFRLPEEVLADQVREWLAEEVVDVVPGIVPGARVLAADLWRMYDASDVSGLQKSRAFALLDKILGPRDFSDRTRPAYTIPASGDREGR
jgi:hypothetical protein